MPRDVIVWDDFSGGEEGRSRPAKGKNNTFRGVNVWQYPAGIGPRPNFQFDGPITGLPSGVPVAVAVDDGGTVHVITGASTPYTIYRINPLTFVATSLGTMANLPSDWITISNTLIICSAAGPGVSVSPGGTVSALAAMPSGTRIAQYGEQTVIANGAILRWSAANDATSWPVLNTVQVGGSNVEDILAQRGRLVFLNAVGEIWQVSGALGTNETYSLVDVVPPPASGSASNSTRPHGTLCRQSGYVFPLRNTKWFANFTGARAYPVMAPDMALSGYAEDDAITVEAMAPLIANDSFLAVSWAPAIAGSAKQFMLWACQEGVWTRHTLPDTLTSTVAAWLSVQGSTYTTGGIFLFTASPSTVLRMYRLNTDQDFPITASTQVDGIAGLPVVADFRTGEVWDEAGDRMTVQSVIVDYSFVNAALAGATYGSPTFDVSVESIQANGSTVVDASTAITFTPPAAANAEAPSTGSLQRYIARGRASFQFGDAQPSAGFRIKLAGWKSILVHRITVVIDKTPEVY